MSFYSNTLAQRLDDTIEVMRLVMPDVLEREREVAHKKWFAYRFMSPLAATKHFAELYSKGFKAYIRFNRDRDEAELRQGLGQNIFHKPGRSLTELWHARQRADELGLPYELLIEFGFEFARKGELEESASADAALRIRKIRHRLAAGDQEVSGRPAAPVGG